MDGELWRIEDLSVHRAEVIIRHGETKERQIIGLNKYYRDKRSVWTMGQIADMFNLDKSRIRDWMLWVELPEYRMVYGERPNNPVSDVYYVKYFSKEQILALYDMIVRVKTKGWPAKDKFKPPYYNLPTRAELLGLLNEHDVYYIKRGDEYVPVFRPEWT